MAHTEYCRGLEQKWSLHCVAYRPPPALPHASRHKVFGFHDVCQPGHSSLLEIRCFLSPLQPECAFSRVLHQKFKRPPPTLFLRLLQYSTTLAAGLLSQPWKERKYTRSGAPFSPRSPPSLLPAHGHRRLVFLPHQPSLLPEPVALSLHPTQAWSTMNIEIAPPPPCAVGCGERWCCQSAVVCLSLSFDEMQPGNGAPFTQFLDTSDAPQNSSAAGWACGSSNIGEHSMYSTATPRPRILFGPVIKTFYYTFERQYYCIYSGSES